MYTAPGFIDGTTDYVISDGKQLFKFILIVTLHTYADMAKHRITFQSTPNDNAEDDYPRIPQMRGFDFRFNVLRLGDFLVVTS